MFSSKEHAAIEAFLATDAVFEALTKMNFQTGPVAHLFRDEGAEIRRKCEDEQAYVLRWLLQLALKHGAEWPKAAAEEVQQLVARRKARLAEAAHG